MAKVLDASALMAYLEKEPGYEKVKDLFVKATETGKRLLMTTVNWGEVFYVLIRDYGLSDAEKIQHLIETFPIELVPVDIGIAKQAAIYKATKKLTFTDCFTLALARLRKAEIVTKDKEFKKAEDQVKISWIE